MHHSSRGQRKSRAREEESELHNTDKDQKTPPPQPDSSACTMKSPARGGLPAWQSRQDRRGGFCGTPWSTSSTPHPSCRSSMCRCRRWGPTGGSLEDRSAQDLLPTVLFARFSVSHRWRKSWWKCLLSRLRFVEQNADIPVAGAQTVDIPVPRCGFRQWRSSRFSPKTRFVAAYRRAAR